MKKYYVYGDYIIASVLNKSIIINRFGLMELRIINTCKRGDIEAYLEILNHKVNMVTANKAQIEIFKSKLNEYINNLIAVKEIL